MNKSILSVMLKFRRQYSGYLITTIIPILLLTIIAFLTFFFEKEDFTNRVMVTLSSLIVLASLFSQSSSALPDTSYTKCIDVIFLSPIFLLSLVFGSHVILAVVNRRSTDRVKFLSQPQSQLGILSKPNLVVTLVCSGGLFVCFFILFIHCW